MSHLHYCEHQPDTSTHPPKPQEPQWTLDVSINLICPDCRENPANIIEEYSSGDTICGSCGLVMAERMIDTRAEWRNFSNDDSSGKCDMNRVGAAPDPFQSGSGLDTTIQRIRGDFKADSIARAHRKITSKTESKNLTKAYIEIDAFCGKIGIQDNVRDVAKLIYKRVDEEMKKRSRHHIVHEAAVASCILIACRQCKVDRTFREIFLLTNVPKRDIGRTFKKIESFLVKTSTNPNAQEVPAPVTHISRERYISTSHTEAGSLMIRFCNLLGYDARFTLAAEELVKKMSAHPDFCARSPLSVAATAIYVIAKVTNKRVDQGTVSKTIGISSSSISTGYRAINVQKETYFDQAWLSKIGGSLACFPNLTVEDMRRYESQLGLPTSFQQCHLLAL